MSNVKISALPGATTPLAGTEVLPLVQAGATVKVAASDLGISSATQTALNLKQATITFGTNVQTALAVNIGSAGAPVLFNGASGTPSSLTLTNATGLPVSTGISGFGTGVATALAVNVGSAGAPVVNGGALGTPSSGTLTNATGLPVGGITQNTARLLGRTTASAGVTEEITVGSGLSLAAGSLTATGSGQSWHPGYVAGRWYLPGGFTTLNSAVTSQNTIRLTPIYIPQTITISDLGTRLQTLSVAGNLQLAVYASDSNKLPTGNVLAATGNISTTTAGQIAGDIAGADVQLTAGAYWFAWNSDNATAIVMGIAAGHAYTVSLIGSASQADIASAVTTVQLSLTIAQTYNTWPDLTAAAFTFSTSTGPAVQFKVASVP